MTSTNIRATHPEQSPLLTDAIRILNHCSKQRQEFLPMTGGVDIGRDALESTISVDVKPR